MNSPVHISRIYLQYNAEVYSRTLFYHRNKIYALLHYLCIVIIVLAQCELTRVGKLARCFILGNWRSRFIYLLFCCRLLFPFPLSSAILSGDFHINRQGHGERWSNRRWQGARKVRSIRKNIFFYTKG
jgi:hypothetical protein